MELKTTSFITALFIITKKIGSKYDILEYVVGKTE